MKSRIAPSAVLLALVTSACLQLQVSPAPASKPEDTPERIQAASDPELVPTQVAGVLHAQLEVPDVYYVEPVERWFRYAMNQWFLAYSWNGYWFPLPQGEVPPQLAEFVPTIEQREERRLTRDEELRALEEELRRIEAEEATERAQQDD
jgi:hypothetical protein